MRNSESLMTRAMASFRGQFWPLLDLYLVYFDWRFCWLRGTSLECAELIYMKTTEAACVSDELIMLFQRRKEQIVSLDDSRIERPFGYIV